MKTWVVLAPILFLCLFSGFAQTSEDELKLGVAAYKESHYQQAIQHFARATQLDSGNINAHLYLATASPRASLICT